MALHISARLYLRNELPVFRDINSQTHRAACAGSTCPFHLPPAGPGSLYLRLLPPNTYNVGFYIRSRLFCCCVCH
jgi:hypothetical protein